MSTLTRESIAGALERYQPKLFTNDDFPGYRRAAVLILLYPGAESPHVLLTVRTDSVETHKGQISCPGGMTDPTDADAVDTALRETEEEIGVSRRLIHVLGRSDDSVTPAGFIITPIVGWADERPVVKVNPAEVQEILTPPLELFAQREHARKEYRTVGKFSGRVWFFDYDRHTIWGATAGMLVRLIDIMEAGVNTPR